MAHVPGHYSKDITPEEQMYGVGSAYSPPEGFNPSDMEQKTSLRPGIGSLLPDLGINPPIGIRPLPFPPIKSPGLPIQPMPPLRQFPDYGKRFDQFGETLGGFGETLGGFESQLGGFGGQISGFEKTLSGLEGRLSNIEKGIASLQEAREPQQQPMMQQGYSPMFSMFSPFYSMGIRSLLGGYYG